MLLSLPLATSFPRGQTTPGRIWTPSFLKLLLTVLPGELHACSEGDVLSHCCTAESASVAASEYVCKLSVACREAAEALEILPLTQPGAKTAGTGAIPVELLGNPAAKPPVSPLGGETAAAAVPKLNTPNSGMFCRSAEKHAERC